MTNIIIPQRTSSLLEPEGNYEGWERRVYSDPQSKPVGLQWMVTHWYTACPFRVVIPIRRAPLDTFSEFEAA